MLATILGIDPGLAATGYGIVEMAKGRLRHVEHGVISTSSDLSSGERLSIIYDAITDIARKTESRQAGVETLYFARNITSAFPVVQARGVVLLALYQSNVVAYEYSPLAIKQAVVGQGRATKEQTQEMARILLGLESIPRPNHAADALAAAICHAHQSTAPFGSCINVQ